MGSSLPLREGFWALDVPTICSPAFTQTPPLPGTLTQPVTRVSKETYLTEVGPLSHSQMQAGEPPHPDFQLPRGVPAPRPTSCFENSMFDQVLSPFC